MVFRKWNGFVKQGLKFSMSLTFGSNYINVGALLLEKQNDETSRCAHHILIFILHYLCYVIFPGISSPTLIHQIIGIDILAVAVLSRNGEILCYTRKNNNNNNPLILKQIDTY